MDTSELPEFLPECPKLPTANEWMKASKKLPLLDAWFRSQGLKELDKALTNYEKRRDEYEFYREVDMAHGTRIAKGAMIAKGAVDPVEARNMNAIQAAWAYKIVGAALEDVHERFQAWAESKPYFQQKGTTVDRNESRNSGGALSHLRGAIDSGRKTINAGLQSVKRLLPDTPANRSKNSPPSRPDARPRTASKRPDSIVLNKQRIGVGRGTNPSAGPDPQAHPAAGDQVQPQRRALQPRAHVERDRGQPSKLQRRPGVPPRADIPVAKSRGPGIHRR
jgi:hypothetical protein